MSELKDILGSGKGRLPEDKLMAYLDGKLSAEEQHEVEVWLAEEGLEADALEGLNNIPAADVARMVSRANYDLHKTISAKKRRRKRAMKDNPWAWVAVVIILLLCILGYVVLNMSVKK